MALGTDEATPPIRVHGMRRGARSNSNAPEAPDEEQQELEEGRRILELANRASAWIAHRSGK